MAFSSVKDIVTVGTMAITPIKAIVTVGLMANSPLLSSKFQESRWQA